MLYHLIRYSEAAYSSLVTMICHELQNSGSKTTHQATILDGNDVIMFGKYFME